MSDIFSADNAAGAGAETSSDFSADTAAVETSAGAAESFDFDFSALDTDKIFGQEPEQIGQSGDSDQNSDVTAANPPVSRQDNAQEVTNETEAAETEQSVETEAAATETDAATSEFNDKLNWDTAPKSFREEYDKVKSLYMQAIQSDVASQYIQEPTTFAEWMKETSPTSYHEIGTLLATESASAAPKEWAAYLAETNPDILAQTVTGNPEMTMERLKAEIALVSDEDDAVQAKIDENREKEQAKEKPAAEETPEQKEIREWREQRQQQELAQVKSQVFRPIEEAVDSLVSSAGLDIKESEYQGKDFAQLDPDTQFKVVVNEMLPVFIDWRIKQNPQMQSMQARLGEFIEKKDAKSAIALQHPAKIAVTNYVNEFLAVLTGFKAKSVQSETIPPTTVPPQPVVKTANAAPVNNTLPDSNKIDWSAEGYI